MAKNGGKDSSCCRCCLSCTGVEYRFGFDALRIEPEEDVKSISLLLLLLGVALVVVGVVEEHVDE